MKKILFIIPVLISSISYGQIVGGTGNTPANRGIGVNDGTKDSILAQQSDKRWTMIHRYDMFGSNARGNFIYSNLAGSSQTGTTEAMIAIGHNALRLNTIGYNTAIGYQNLYNLDAGSFGNIADGPYRVMFNQTSGNNNVARGYNIDQPNLTGSNQYNEGNGIYGVNFNTTTGSTASTTARVSIGINVPAASGILDLTSTTMGFLAPRMTTTQRDAISSPATGLMIYNTTTSAINVYSGGWVALGGYNLIQNEGSGITARTTINFIGYGVNAVDNASKSEVTIKGFNLEDETTDLLTTNNTQTTQATVTIPSGSAGILTVHIHAQLDDQLGSFVSVLRIGYNKTAGGTLSLGTVQVSGNEYIGAGISAASATLDASSDNIRVRVTGETSKNIYWNSYYFLTNVIPEL